MGYAHCSKAPLTSMGIYANFNSSGVKTSQPVKPKDIDVHSKQTPENTRLE